MVIIVAQFLIIAYQGYVLQESACVSIRAVDQTKEWADLATALAEQRDSAIAVAEEWRKAVIRYGYQIEH